jgi:hypothetical protein
VLVASELFVCLFSHIVTLRCVCNIASKGHSLGAAVGRQEIGCSNILARILTLGLQSRKSEPASVEYGKTYKARIRI